ncbi:hypothetical protein MUK42_26617 [Musa troglodytarum]|uniref:Transmembrane protein n=1 Tax=Musa troglodytarum TaxID=320322 RepID=A0A9E7F437_9LILI|nr:hypothetical protein MUK42_26617 [Musa troglodytarum]
MNVRRGCEAFGAIRESKAEFTPIGVMLGLLLMALSIGAHTGRQQLVHSPGVRVSKKKRELTAEVEEPEHVAGEADRFVTKSFSRKVAHLQDFDAVRSDPSPPSIRSVYSLLFLLLLISFTGLSLCMKKLILTNNVKKE